MQKKSRIIILVLGMTLAVLGVLACAPVAPSAGLPTSVPAPAGGTSPTAAPAAATEQKITIVNRSPGWQLDPVIQVGSSLRFVEPLYEGLLDYNGETQQYVPTLATEWNVSDDGLTYTFKLREGVKFHDGTTFNAEAVKTTYDRVKAIKLGISYLVNPVQEVEVVDDYTVRFHLSNPYPIFPYVTFKIKIVSPTAIKAHEVDGDWAQKWLESNAVGTGPYILTHYDPQTTIEYAPFPDYWRGWQGTHLQQIVFRLVTEPATQRQMLERGDADMIVDQVLVEDVPAYESNPDIEVVSWSAGQQMIMTLRSDKPPLDDLRVREALRLAFPYEDLVAANGNVATQAQGPLPKSLPQHDASLVVYKQDLAKAKALLTEAGIRPGQLKLEVDIVQALAAEKKAAELFQSALAELGVQLKIVELQWPVLVAKARNKDEAPDMTMLIHDAGMPSPGKLLTEAYACGSAGVIYNWAWFCNSELDQVLQEAGKTTDPKAAAALYQKAQQILNEQSPALFLLDPPQVFAYRSWVKGFKPDPVLSVRLNLYDMYIQK